MDHLTAKILDGTLKVGDELPAETELANAFQVSKPTVRDALRHLATLGVVEIRQGRPSVIGQVRSDTLSQFFRFAVAGARNKFKDILEVRRAIECAAASAAALNITAEQADELRHILGKLQENKHDHDGWVYWDSRFHTLISRASGNVLFPCLMEALQGLMEDTIRVVHTQARGRDPEKTYQRHAALGEAILARREETARELMQEHFDASLTFVMAVEHESKATAAGAAAPQRRKSPARAARARSL
jgi:GntR family transcriptional repressor for pyruvate dehydrogenase complex